MACIGSPAATIVVYIDVSLIVSGGIPSHVKIHSWQVIKNTAAIDEKRKFITKLTVHTSDSLDWFLAPKYWAIKIVVAVLMTIMSIIKIFKI